MSSFCWRCTAPMNEGETVCPSCGHDCAAHQNLPHQLSPGTLLSERYAVGEVLGEGGFGITYVGKDLRLGRKIAIKEFFMRGFVTRTQSVSSEVTVTNSSEEEVFTKNRDRFLGEAKVLASFSHEDGIVGVHDFFVENNTAYIVMTFLDGETLKERLLRSGTLSWAQTFGIMRPVLVSLAEVHRHGVIHRDISPDNLMLTSRGQVKLLDFGAAREFDRQDPRSMSIILKPGYAPYEQYQSRGVQGPWTDVYALCATMYRCLTGIVPDDAMDRLDEDRIKAPAELCDCPAHVSAALMKGLSVRRQDRFQSVDELMAALEAPRAAPAPVQQQADPDATVYVHAAAPAARTAPPVQPKPEPKPEPEPPAEPQDDSTVFVQPSVQREPELPSAQPEPEPPAAPPKKASSSAKKRVWKAVLLTAVVLAAAALILGLIAANRLKNQQVLAVGLKEDGQLAVSKWENVVSIAAGECHTVGLLSDGTVVAAGNNDDGQCDVADWTDVVAVAAGEYHTIGLLSDGTLLFAGSNYSNVGNVYRWTDIVSVAAAFNHTVGLRSDGTVAAAGV